MHLGNRFRQGWEFYAITLCLYVVLGYPGFVYRYLCRGGSRADQSRVFRLRSPPRGSRRGTPRAGPTTFGGSSDNFPVFPPGNALVRQFKVSYFPDNENLNKNPFLFRNRRGEPF